MSDHFNFDFDFCHHGIQPRTNHVTNLFDWFPADSTSRTSAPVTRNMFMRQSAFQQPNNSNMDLYQLMINSTRRSTFPNDQERNITYSRRDINESRMYQNGNNNGCSNGSNQSFFDCNICLDLSKEPILTSCGHLYCWYCFHKWLQVSKAKECPICKGEVSLETVIPIYGRAEQKREFFEIPDTNIPSRPHARRVDSFPTIFNRFMSSRGIRGDEENQGRAAAIVEALPAFEEGNQRFGSLFNGRLTIENQGRARAAIVEPLDDINFIQFLSVERLLSYEENENEGNAGAAIVEPLDLNLNVDVDVDDRDSESSRMGVIMNSENEVDNIVEITSMEAVSNGLDSEDSHPIRRRRFT